MSDAVQGMAGGGVASGEAAAVHEHNTFCVSTGFTTPGFDRISLEKTQAKDEGKSGEAAALPWGDVSYRTTPFCQWPHSCHHSGTTHQVALITSKLQCGL